MIIVRGVFQARYGKGDELVELFKEANAMWHSGQNVRLLTDLSGPFFTVVSEAEYDSFSAWEANAQQIFGDARFAAFFERMTPLVESGRREFYNLIEGASMTNREAEWSDTLLHLLALAARLEGEGQYNMAKLARATAESLTRQAAFKIALPSEKDKLAGEVEQAIAALSKLGLNKDVLAALKRGGTAMADGRLPLITETPHPYVCRTCGHIVLKAPAEKCSTCGAWPTTFKQFLPVYWLDALEPFAALERLRQTPLDVAVLLEGLPEDALSCPPADGGWAIRNVVSHLRDAQGVLSFRLSLLLEQENPLLESKAVFAWATNEEERSPTTQEIFEVYRASRQETIAQLESLPLSDWWRTGQHEEFGPVTLRQQVSYFAAHEMTHLPQIEALRRRYSAAGIIR